MHHLLLAHGWGTQAIRAAAPRAKIGITNALGQVYPATDSDKDRGAAANAQQVNQMFLQPLVTGAYHKALMTGLLGLPKRIRPGDMEAIQTPIDFLGVNSYTRAKVKRVRFSLLGYEGVLPDPAQVECTDMGWEVAPSAMYDLLMWVHREYPKLRLVVTENGAAYPDVVGAGGAVDDARRTSYLERHLAEVQRAIADGCPVDAYYVWSLLDNFEWTHGYEKRFGIVHVDYATQRRTIKQSGHWYQRLCRDRSL
jgi:beta-glucosidase